MEATIRQLTTLEEFLEMDKIANVSYVISRDLEAQLQKRKNELNGPRYFDAWGVFDEDGNMGAAMVNNHYLVEFDGSAVPASGIGGVCSLPEFRSKGGVRAIFRRILQEEWENGCVFSYLFPFSFPYYRKFGYELLHTAERLEVPLEALADFTCSYSVTMCQTAGITEDMCRIYEQFLPGKNLSVYRGDVHWRDSKGDPYQDRRYKYIFYDAQKNPRAYLVFHPEQGERRIVTVDDLAYLAPEDFRQMLGFLYRLRAQFGSVSMILPEDVPLVAMIPDSRAVKHTRSTQGQLRVVNVQKALEAMRCPQESGSAVIGVADAFLPENTGNYLLTFADGKAVSVEKVPQLQPDIRLSIQRLSQLVTGFLCLSEAAYLSDVEIFNNHAMLEKLFVHKPIYFRDHF